MKYRIRNILKDTLALALIFVVSAGVATLIYGFM